MTNFQSRDNDLATSDVSLDEAAFRLWGLEDMLRAFVTDIPQEQRQVAYRDHRIVYNDSFADEIREARQLPGAVPEIRTIRFRGLQDNVILAFSWVANVVASGALGNAAWELLKAKSQSYRKRANEDPMVQPLTPEEARTVALIGLAVAGILEGEPPSEERGRISEAGWDFVFERAGRRWQVAGKHADPMMTRLSIREIGEESEYKRNLSPGDGDSLKKKSGESAFKSVVRWFRKGT